MFCVSDDLLWSECPNASSLMLLHSQKYDALQRWDYWKVKMSRGQSLHEGEWYSYKSGP